MKILAVETATEACSAALSLDGEIAERHSIAPREHTRLILPMLESLLVEADLTLNQLDALAFGCGPGSFTGLRIAAGVIQGLALGAELPVVAISTLAAMAQGAFSKYNDDIAYAALDARMGEVYWGVYRRTETGFAELLGEETVVQPQQVWFPERDSGVGIGSAWSSYRTELKRRLGEQVLAIDVQFLPRARAVAQLGTRGYLANEGVPAEQALPVYLRDKVARKNKNKYC